MDIGRGKCIPCKKMAPILEELAETYKGKAIVEIINLDVTPEAAQKYGIRLIPTQIFYDREGQETWRHEGFLPRDQIVARFRELGLEEL